MMHVMCGKSLQAEIDWLYGLQHFGIKLGLDNIRILLNELSHPQSAFHSTLIAGTNGKGSVGAMLDSMLDAAGVRTGLFTSPHLVRPNERIRVGTRDIDDATLRKRLAEMRKLVARALERGTLATHPSFFEVITATALQSFKDSVRRGKYSDGVRPASWFPSGVSFPALVRATAPADLGLLLVARARHDSIRSGARELPRATRGDACHAVRILSEPTDALNARAPHAAAHLALRPAWHPRRGDGARWTRSPPRRATAPGRRRARASRGRSG